jgi:hypothetical protein
MAHINIIIPNTLDTFQFTYRPTRYTVDAISIALHTALSHLDRRNTYSVCENAVHQLQLSVQHHSALQAQLNTSLCNWILDFLTGRPQVVSIGISYSPR